MAQTDETVRTGRMALTARTDELGLVDRVILEKTGVFTAPDGSETEGGFGLAGTLPHATQVYI